MDIFSIMNVITTQHHRCRANIPINTSVTMNVLTMQRCKRCTFDSPGLASESEGYPGLFAISENNAVGVVRLIAQGWQAKAKATLGYLPLARTTL